MGDRRAKQCHETFPEELVDGALVPMDFGERQREELVDDSMHRFGADAVGQRSRADEVAEEDRYLLALSFQGGLGGKDSFQLSAWVASTDPEEANP
jgi:hypothetical protein